MDQVFAFTTKHSYISSTLKNEVYIVNASANVNVKVIALWDTGATKTCITSNVANKLGLKPTGMAQVGTPSGVTTRNTYLIDVILPNSVRVTNVEACEAELTNQGIDALIGMNIIGLGDLSVSNYNNKTFFSFRIPSVEHTDYVQQINVTNKIGIKHGKGIRKKKKR